LYACVVFIFSTVQNINAIEIVSLGGGCVIARAMRHNNQRTKAYPFDWLITPIKALETAFFDDFSHILVPAQTYERDNRIGVVDGYGFAFMHDFPTICNPIASTDSEIMPSHPLTYEWRTSIGIVREKFARRLDRLLTLLREGTPVALVRYHDVKYYADHEVMDSTRSKHFIALLKQKFPQARVNLVTIGSSPEFHQPWHIPHVCNLYIDEKDSRVWDGPAWSNILQKITTLQPQGWMDDASTKDAYLLTLPLYNSGLFNTFNTVIGALDQYDRGNITGLRIDFEDKGWYFDAARGHNWWSYYFEPIVLGVVSDSKKEILFPTYQKIIFAYHAQFEMSRERAHELIEKYIHILPHIRQKVDFFCKHHFTDCFVLGIHYRGTDKVFESSPVDYKTVTQHIHAVLNAHRSENVKIFVATDDSNFAAYIQDQFPHLVVMCDALRSNNESGVHTRLDLAPYQKGEDAIIDCLLLSKCSLLIKMASNLSDCSLQFNPHIPVIKLNISYSE